MYVTEWLQHMEEDHKERKVARYLSQIVTVHTIKRRWTLSRALLLELRDVRLNLHGNLMKFYGICVNDSFAAYVTEFASRGSLQDLFLGPQNSFEWNLRYSLFYDLIEVRRHDFSQWRNERPSSDPQYN